MNAEGARRAERARRDHLRARARPRPRRRRGERGHRRGSAVAIVAHEEDPMSNDETSAPPAAESETETETNFKTRLGLRY